ncbi:MAG: GNAT family N-acetyltransferase [Armatimonadota bacterium]|nr:GNAT family N-acetyltransferase [Armatimonadota bacterium]MDR5674986.1 GNAT family N-acetyltransferase [Armatimonadota bacterium]MDR7386592.1 GNAT family N-acetyltransferase [Armatimonadota bacterium]MDR7388739.1 GNAT family N-acetyltransferase [Armatimonadota bacterium]MDR7392204.1 GNAT family N-acetyltransferase [Armatimonadota bacterium]
MASSAPVRIRAARSADVTACARIVASEPLWQRYGISQRRAAAMIRAAVRAGEPVLVAVRGAEVLGFVWFQLRGTFVHSGYVRWIATARSARGQGVGRLLLRTAEERILRHGPNVFLLVSRFNRRAQRFYRMMGYERVGMLRDYVRQGLDEWIYRKTTGPLVSGTGGRDPSPGR